MNHFQTVVSRNTLELMLTALLAFVFAAIYKTSPLGISLGVIGLAGFSIILLKKPEYAVLLLAVVLPFRDIPIVSIMHVKRLIIWGLLLSVFIRQVTTRTPQPLSRRIRRFYTYAGLFIAALGVALIQTISQIHSSIYLTTETLKTIFFADALLIIEQLLVLYIIYYSLQTWSHIQRMLDVMLVTSVFIAGLGIFQYYKGSPPALLNVLFRPGYEFYGRATSVFSNPNGLGIFLAPIIAILLIFLFWPTISSRKRFGFILPILLIDSWAVFLSFSRTAMVQILFSFLVMSYLYYFKINRKRLTWKIVALLMLNIVLIGAALHSYERYAQLRIGGTAHLRPASFALERIKTVSDYARKHAAKTAFLTFKEHPLLGVGYDIIAGKRLASVIWVENQFLKILAEMGLFGFLPFLLMLGSLLRTGLNIWAVPRESPPSPQHQLIMFLLMTAVSTHMFGYLFVDYLPEITITGYLWIFAGAIFAIEARPNLTSEPETESQGTTL